MINTDYSNKTDHEINKLVAKKLGVYHEDWEHLIDEKKKWVPVSCGCTPYWVDYCNDWRAMGIIIEKYKISIEFRGHKSLDPIAKRFGSDAHNVAHKNLLRAAAIVFLEMGE